MISPALSGCSCGLVGGRAAALDRGLADAVLEAERGAPGRELVAVLAPDQLDPGRARAWARRACSATASSALGVGGEHGDGDVHVAACRAASPSGRGRSRRRRPGRRRGPPCPAGTPARSCPATSCGTPSAFRPVVGEGDGDPGVRARIGRRPAGVDEREQPPHQLAAGRAVVDAQQQVGADVGRRPLVQRPALDVVELEAGVRVDGHGVTPSVASGAREAAGGSGFGAARYGKVRVAGRVAWSTPSRIDRPVAGVDQLREQRVHHVVVERPAPAGLVRPRRAGRRARSRGRSRARRRAW